MSNPGALASGVSGAETQPPVSSYGGPSQGPTLTMTPEQVSAWWNRVQGALDSTRDELSAGKVNVDRYKAKYLTAVPSDDTVVVPTDYYYVNGKAASLFYRLPDIYLRPMKPGVDDAAVVFQAALNQKLGRQGLNVLPRVKQVVFDVLCPTGFGALKVGYQVVTDGMTQVQVGTEPDPNAAPQPGNVLRLVQPMRPVMGPAPNIVAKWYFVEHVSPGDLLIPADFVGMDFDAAPWLGVRFKEDATEDANQSSSDYVDDERRLTPLPDAARAAQRKQRLGYEIWYRASIFDPDVKHPDKLRCFRIYDDQREQAVDLKDSPYQRCDPAGKLLVGVKGYPIRPLTLRYVSDTWKAPSDCTIARPLADELSRGRTQMLQYRNRSMPQVGIDTTKVDRDTQQKIQRNETGALIGFDGPYQDATWPIAKGEFKRESFTFNDYVQRDLDRLWSVGPNPGGALSDVSRTATEQQLAATAAQTQLESERNQVLNWYLGVVECLAGLLQLFADETEFTELVGQNAQRLKVLPPEVQQQAQQNPQASVLVPWNKDSIQGQFLFAAKADSQLFYDAAAYRKQLMDEFNFFAKNPTMNLTELTREIVQAYGQDPSKLMQPPPPAAPEPPKPTLAFQAATDLNPLSPQYANVKAVLEALGVKGLADPQLNPVDAQAVQMLSKGAAPPQQHGGAALLAEKLSQHPLNQTGNMQGSGQPAPIAPGGHLG